MSQQETLYEKIDSYLSGSMSKQDLLAFEQELALRPDWQKKVKAYRLTSQLILEHHLLEVKDLVKGVHKQQGKEGWKELTLYSVGLLLVAGGLFTWYNAPPVSAPSPSVSTTTPSKESKPPVLVESSSETVAKVPSRKEAVSSVPIPVQRVESKELSLPTPLERKTVEIRQETMPFKEVPAPETPQKPIDPCTHVTIEASIFSTPTCDGEEKGSVVLSAFKGGKAPYQWTLRNANEHSLASSGLPKGIYHAIVSDAHHCSTVLQGIEIKEKRCESSHHFNPFVGERWEIPVQTISGTLTVLDKNGNVYFSTELAAGAQEFWSGESTQGEMKTGYYVFTISHPDGTVRRGTISIVR